MASMASLFQTMVSAFEQLQVLLIVFMAAGVTPRYSLHRLLAWPTCRHACEQPPQHRLA
jgi:hypothetical protein